MISSLPRRALSSASPRDDQPRSSLFAPLQVFLAWWGRELTALMPRAVRQASPRSEPSLVLDVGGDGWRLLHESDARFSVIESRPGAEIESLELGALLAGQKAAHRRLPVGLRVPSSWCLVRDLDLPAGARADYPSILKLDLESRTPFRDENVLSGYFEENAGRRLPAERVRLRHVILKRDRIDPLLNQLATAGIEIAFADCWDEAGKGPLPVNLLAVRSAASRGTRRTLTLTRLLAVLVLILAVSGLYQTIAIRDRALATLDDAEAQAQLRARAARQSITQSQANFANIEALIDMKRDEISKAALIEELTRIMPDTAWVSALRIDGDVIDISGFAKSAASLVALLERSPTFADAALTAPVTVESEQNTEHFSIRLHVHPRVKAAAAVQQGAPK